MPGTRKLGRTSDHRKAMLRAMVTYLLENGKIETTVTRAKEVRALTEKMITVAKANNLSAKRQALAFITKEGVVKKLFDEIAPKYQDVNGGYCRIIKTGTRRGDAADLAHAWEVVGHDIAAKFRSTRQRPCFRTVPLVPMVLKPPCTQMQGTTCLRSMDSL